MTSPYLDPRAQKYSPGNQNKTPGMGTVDYAQILVPYNSDGLKQYIKPKANPVSGAGKVRDQRKVQNQGFNL